MEQAAKRARLSGAEGTVAGSGVLEPVESVEPTAAHHDAKLAEPAASATDQTCVIMSRADGAGEGATSSHQQQQQHSTVRGSPHGGVEYLSDTMIACRRRCEALTSISISISIVIVMNLRSCAPGQHGYYARAYVPSTQPMGQLYHAGARSCLLTSVLRVRLCLRVSM
jgi:hypothetical protein